MIEHLNLLGDTVETLVLAFELLINDGYTAIRLVRRMLPEFCLRLR